MRELKFRAYIKSIKKMSPVLILTLTTCTTAEGIYLLRDVELMQFTGLHDKTGKEIYEGDIIYSPHHVPANMQIEFIQGGFCATFSGCFYPFDIAHFYPSTGTSIKVVGNIHENPELFSAERPENESCNKDREQD